jgi:hypothetical protein
MSLSPEVLGSLSAAAVSIAQSIPTAQLAKFGLIRGTALAPLPIAGAVFVGAAVTALAVPPARKWLFEQTRGLFEKAKESIQEAQIKGVNGASEQPAEPAHDGQEAAYAQA